MRALFAVRREQLAAAEDLVRRRYAWRGYDLCSASGTANRDPAPRLTLIAQNESELLGTLTVRPGAGHHLLAEQTFGSEIAAMRARDRRVGEVVKLALEHGAGYKALEVLIRSAYAVTRFMHGLTDVVIEVNPRHVRFYEKALGFVVGATERFCERVRAPAVLMVLDLQEFGVRVQQLDL